MCVTGGGTLHTVDVVGDKVIFRDSHYQMVMNLDTAIGLYQDLMWQHKQAKRLAKDWQRSFVDPGVA